VSDYGLDDRAIGVRFPAEAKDFSSILCEKVNTVYRSSDDGQSNVEIMLAVTPVK
jgi:hypothetical protein